MDASLFSRYTQSREKKRETERGELLREFLETINSSRRGTKFPQLTFARIGALVQHIETSDLYFLLSVCKDSGNRHKRYADGFSSKFFYELKPKEVIDAKRQNARR